MDCTSSSSDWKLARLRALRSGTGICTRVPMAPMTWFSSSTAALASMARRLVTAAPGGSATAAPAWARARPSRVMSAAGMPQDLAAAGTPAAASGPFSRPRPKAPPAPLSMATRARARASMPSLPGRMGSHSSLLEAVSESRAPA